MSEGRARTWPARGAIVGGLAGQAILALGVILAGLLKPGYSHVEGALSSLGKLGSETFWLFNGAVGLGGLATVAMGLAFRRVPATSIAAPIVVGTGVALIALAATPCTEVCPLQGGRISSVRDGAHLVVGIAVVVASILAPLAIGLRGRVPAAYRRGSWWLGLLSAAAAIVYATLGESSDLQGVSQRAMIVPPFAWLAVTGWLALTRWGEGSAA